MDNHSYDVFKALTKKADAITVYDQYLKDSKNCEECQKFWSKLKEKDSKDLEELKKLSTTHLQMNN
jgi:hypothetical protein